LFKLYESREKISLFLRLLTRILIYADNRERLRKTFKRFYVWLLKDSPVTELDHVSERLATKISEADRQVLRKLKTLGHSMMALSCGTADLSERILNMAGIIDCFDVIEGNRFEIDNDQIVGMNLQIMEPSDKVKFLNEIGIASDATVAVGDGYSDIALLDWSRIPKLISPPLRECVVTGKTTHIRLFVIPGLTRNPLFFNALRYWMPDQVRHDRHKFNVFLNYDTASDGRGIRGGWSDMFLNLQLLRQSL
jgi:phosphoserine phosphatase